MTDRQILRVIGRNVKAARVSADVTQECLAELVGVHWQTVSYIETGKVPCSILTLLKISQVLEVSANRLFDGVGEADKKRIAEIKVAMKRKRKASS